MLKLRLNEIEDEYVKQNFERISLILNNFALLRGEWQFFELTFAASVSNFRFEHNLGFKPKDVLVTSQIGAGSATFNYSLFTSTHIDISTSGAVVVRFFAGSYSNSIN